MANTTARVASLLAEAAAATTVVATSVTTATVATSAAIVAVAGNVTYLTALFFKLNHGQHCKKGRLPDLVALLATTSATTNVAAPVVAVTRDVAGLAAAVAGLDRVAGALSTSGAITA